MLEQAPGRTCGPMERGAHAGAGLLAGFVGRVNPPHCWREERAEALGQGMGGALGTEMREADFRGLWVAVWVN